MWCIEKYIEGILNNINTFGMGLDCQAYSHLELVKAIGGIIAFEVYKREQKDTVNSISHFSVPFDLFGIIYNFNSLSYKALRAIESFEQYGDRKYKEGFFNKKKTFYKSQTWNYFLKVASSSS